MEAFSGNGPSCNVQDYGRYDFLIWALYASSPEALSQKSRIWGFHIDPDMIGPF